MSEPLPAASTDHADLDRAVAALRAGADAWARRPLAEKRAWLLETRARLGRLAERWVRESVAAKRIDPGSPWVGEEWVTGPWALAAAINGLLETVTAVERGGRPRLAGLRTGPDGRLVVPVFPRTLLDRLLLSGVRAEVWMQPGVTAADLARETAAALDRPPAAGQVTLVLGGGNINAIPALDALDRLFAHGSAALVKVSPVNEYMAPILSEVFAPFVAGGTLHFVTGGAEAGAFLTRHPGIDAIHITGSARTHDAIVFGPGPEGEARRRRNAPLLTKPITSELSGVGPVIVVPGPWSRADLRFQAENVATMKLHNAGCNCVAAQVLVTPRDWPLRDAFLGELRRLFAELPPRPAYYPGAAERWQAVAAVHPEAERFAGDPPLALIAGLDPGRSDEVCFRQELFGAVLGETALPGADAASFLDAAVDFCNERLDGTLGASLIIHPRTRAELGDRFEAALARLRYGAIGVNAWNAVAFLLAQCTWGAFPGHTLEAIGSGRGVVHNSFLFTRPERSVAYGPFRPFPRSWAHGEASLLPRPPWFVTNRTAATTARRVAAVTVSPGWRHLPGIFASALRG